jgi:hypothetical protein
MTEQLPEEIIEAIDLTREIASRRTSLLLPTSPVGTSAAASWRTSPRG